MERSTVILLAFGFPLAIVLGYFLSRFFADRKLKQAEIRVKDLTESAKREAENRKKESELAAKDLLIKMRQDFEKESKDKGFLKGVFG